MTLYCSWHPRGWLTPTWIVFLLAVCCFFTSNAVIRALTTENCETYAVTQALDCAGTYIRSPATYYSSSWFRDANWSKLIFLQPRGLVTYDTQVAIQAQSLPDKGWTFWGSDDIKCGYGEPSIWGKVSCKKEFCFQDREMPDKIRDQVENPRQHTWTPTPPVLRLMDWKFGEEGYYVNRNGNYTQSNRWYKILSKEERVDYPHNSYSTYLELDQLGTYNLYRRGVRIHGFNPEEGAVISATSGLLNPWISYLEDPNSLFYGIYRQTGKYSYVMMDFPNLEIASDRPTLVPDVPSITLEYGRGIVSAGDNEFVQPMRLTARKQEDGCEDVVEHLSVIRWDQKDFLRPWDSDEKIAYTHKLRHSVCVDIGSDCT